MDIGDGLKACAVSFYRRLEASAATVFAWKLQPWRPDAQIAVDGAIWEDSALRRGAVGGCTFGGGGGVVLDDVIGLQWGSKRGPIGNR